MGLPEAPSALWADVAADPATAAAEAGRAGAKAESLPRLDPAAREDRELAIGKHLHDAYCAAESALERLILALDGELPRGPRYHRDLVERAARPLEGMRPAMIGTGTRAALGGLAAFRHAYRHAYGGFARDLAAPNVPLAAESLPRLIRELEDFGAVMGLRPGQG